MSTRNLKKWALLLTFWAALHIPNLRAQTLTGYSAATFTGGGSDLTFRTDGTLMAKGAFGTGSLVSGEEGAGTRMLWFPAKGAFRAGIVYGTEWNHGNLGGYSVAFGSGTTASGYASFAHGDGSSAIGDDSVAFGNTASAIGGASFAFGLFSTSIGPGSLAFGSGGYAGGQYSTAFGNGGYAYGDGSLAFGAFTSASGNYTTASGYQTVANAYLSTVIGRYNLGTYGTGGKTTWLTTDPLFEVGNGTSGHPADALIIYKNGNAAIQGKLTTGDVITAAPGGDIPVFTGS